MPEEEALPPLAVVVVVVVPAAAAFLLRAEESRRWASTSPRVLRVEREREKDRGVREEVVEEKRAKKKRDRTKGRKTQLPLFLSSSLHLPQRRARDHLRGQRSPSQRELVRLPRPGRQGSPGDHPSLQLERGRERFGKCQRRERGGSKGKKNRGSVDLSVRLGAFKEAAASC